MTYMSGMDAFGRCTKCGSPGVDTAGKCYHCEYQKYVIPPSTEPTPHTCPTCNGTGKVSRPPWLPGDVQTWTTNNPGETFDCGSCDGKGILWR
jgi:hypothetical protein